MCVLEFDPYLFCMVFICTRSDVRVLCIEYAYANLYRSSETTTNLLMFKTYERSKKKQKN